MHVKILSFLFCTILLSHCSTVNKKKPDNLIRKANQYAADGLLREAIDAYTDLAEKNPDDYLVNKNLGILYLKVASYKKALSHLDQAYQVYNQDPQLNFYLGENHRALDNYIEALVYYKRCMNFDPQHMRALKALSWSLYKIRAYKQAQQYALKLYKKSPDLQSLIILGKVYLRNDKTKALRKLLKNSIARKHESNIFLMTLKGDYALRKKNLGQAQSLYKKVLKREPLTASALFGMGKIYIKKGKKEDALDYLKRSIRVYPENAEAYFLVAQLLRSQKPQIAHKFYGQFLKLAAGDPEFRKESRVARKQLAHTKR